MNWLVQNVEHNTTEATVAALPRAIEIADYYKDSLHRLLVGGTDALLN